MSSDSEGLVSFNRIPPDIANLLISQLNEKPAERRELESEEQEIDAFKYLGDIARGEADVSVAVIDYLDPDTSVRLGYVIGLNLDGVEERTRTALYVLLKRIRANGKQLR